MRNYAVSQVERDSRSALYLDSLLILGRGVKDFGGLERVCVDFKASFTFSNSLCLALGFSEMSLSRRLTHMPCLSVPNPDCTDLTGYPSEGQRKNEYSPGACAAPLL